MRPTRMRRLPRDAAYIGRNRYFVTIDVFGRQPLFASAQLVETCREHALAAYRSTAFDLLTECYMPDHLHVLLQGLHGTSDLRRCIKDMKQRTAYHVRRIHTLTLWQDGYHERILGQDEDAANYADYIMQNPVRAGLVTRPEDYPYSFSSLTRRPDL